MRQGDEVEYDNAQWIVGDVADEDGEYQVGEESIPLRRGNVLLLGADGESVQVIDSVDDLYPEQQNVDDEIESKRQAIYEQYRPVMNVDTGNITQLSNVAGTDNIAYVVKGKVVYDEDGNIDYDRSDDTIYYKVYDKDGNEVDGGTPKPIYLKTRRTEFGKVLSDVPIEEYVDNELYPQEQNNIRQATNNGQTNIEQSTPAESVSTDERQDITEKNDSTEFDENGGYSNIQNTVLSDEEADLLMSAMEQNAEAMPVIELTPDNWVAEFGQNRTVSTPIGDVKMGDNQLAKLFLKKRTREFGMIKPTLINPDVIIEKTAVADNAERNTKLLFVKTFKDENGQKHVHFENVTVQKGGLEVSISSHIVDKSAIRKELANGIVIYNKPELTSIGSDVYLTETHEGQSDLVPTQKANSDLQYKGTTNNLNEQGEFYNSLPRNKKGEVDESQMSAEQKIMYAQIEFGQRADLVRDYVAEQSKALSEKIAKLTNKAGKSVAEYKELAAMQEDKNVFVEYLNEQRQQQEQATPRRTVEEAAAEREERRAAEKEQREQAIREKEEREGVPDFMQDTPEDARLRGFRLRTGERIDRQEPITLDRYNTARRKFTNDTGAVEGGRPTVKRTIIDNAQTKLQPSHRGGRSNIYHFITEAQPKERTDKASRVSAAQIAANINPEEITGGITAYNGSPIANNRLEVIQGNNRAEALRLMYEEYPKSAEAYKQYLIDNAENYGMSADEVRTMKEPIAVDIYEGTDGDAILLGQYTQQDVESGGVHRINPSGVIKHLKSQNMLDRFITGLLKGVDEENTISDVISANLRDVLPILDKTGAISMTQRQGFFDERGDVTSGAIDDFKGILTNLITEGGYANINNDFLNLPDSAKTALYLQTYRAVLNKQDGPTILNDIQNSILLYTLVFGNNNKGKVGVDESRREVMSWLMTAQPDFNAMNEDGTYPLVDMREKFSNFAAELAILYKSTNLRSSKDKGRGLYTIWDDFYNLLEGKGDLFTAGEKKSLPESINENFNIDYVPIRQNEHNTLGSRGEASRAGRRGSESELSIGEQSEAGTETADDRGRSEADIAEAVKEIDVEPTEAQKKAGNYKKGHVKIQGFDITIENPKGAIRKGVDDNGKAWSTEMKNHYGYFKNTEGKDGDHIDVFIGDNPNSKRIFVVDQVNPKTKEFDESKVMLGFDTEDEAKKAYLSNYSKDWKGFKDITYVDIDTFRDWLYDGAKQRKPFGEYSNIRLNAAKHKAQETTTEKLEELVTLLKKTGFADVKTGEDFYNALAEIGDKEGSRFMIGKQATEADVRAIADETSDIKAKAISDGTFMKAPNGKDTNLTERQWLQVRTKAFKRWFGDWENAYKLELIENLQPIGVDNKGLSRERAEEEYKNIGTSKTNRYDNRRIEFVSNAFGKIARHKNSALILDIIPQLNDLFESAIPIYFEEEREPLKSTNIVGSHNYLGKVRVNNEDYYVRITAQELTPSWKQNEKQGKSNFHNMAVSDIAIYDESGSSVTAKDYSIDNDNRNRFVDAKLQHFFKTAREARKNSSKVVDENGEPLVVYHGTNKFGFTVFDKEFSDDKTSIFFTDRVDIAKGYAGVNADVRSLYDDDTAGGYSKDEMLSMLFADVDISSHTNGWDVANDILPYITEDIGITAEYDDEDGVLTLSSDYTGDTYRLTDEEFSWEKVENWLRDNADLENVIDKNAGIYGVFVNARNVLDIDAGGSMWSYIPKKKVKGAEGVGNMNTRDIVEHAKKLNYDGVYIKDLLDTGGRGYGLVGDIEGDIFISLVDKNQIKSATDNIGTFDGKDEDIRYRRPNGTVLGFVKGNTIYLNPDEVSLNTPIHEFGHLWVSQVKEHFPDLWAKGKELFLESDYLRKVQADPNYQHLDLDGQIDEAMARAIGDRGEQELDKTLLEKILDWIAEVWEKIGGVFGIDNLTSEQISNLTLQDFTDMATSELLSGQNLTERGREKPYTVRDVEGEHRIINLNKYEPLKKWLWNANITQKDVDDFNRWLQQHKNEYVRLYHGTSERNNISDEGIKKTSSKNRKSYQSQSGYVYLSRYPNMARSFGEINNMSDTQVYAVDIKIKDLLPDLDQLNNQRAAGKEIGNTLAESLIYGGGARIKRDIMPYEISSTRYNTADETSDIKAKAISDGTFMKAPNGKDTNLTERQWLQVRTKAFKKWFGDWEKTARIEKLKKTKPIEITGEEYKGKYELNVKSGHKWILDNLRGIYTVKDTGEKVNLSRVSANEITSHGEREDIHLKSFAVIPQMIENAIFIDETDNYKSNNKYDKYKYYVVGLNVDGVPYTARIVVGEKNGKTYYDHELTQIEKGTIIESLNGTTTSVAKNDNAFSEYKDNRLFSLLQENSSKVVDENGEPMVVYHGTWVSRGENYDKWNPKKEAPFYQFNKSDNGIHFGTEDQAEYIIARKRRISEEDKGDYTGFSHIYASFLNIRNMYETYDAGLRWAAVISEAKSNGYDGLFYGNTHEGRYKKNSYVVFNSTQIKSATDNIGTFNEEDEDIRYMLVNVQDEKAIDEERRRPKFEIKGEDVYTTMYTTRVDTETEIDVLYNGNDFEKALSEAEGYNEDSDREDLTVSVEAMRLKIPVAAIKEEYDYDNEEYDGYVAPFVEDYIDDFVEDVDYDRYETGRDMFDVYKSKLDADEHELIGTITDKLQQQTGLYIGKYSTFYITKNGEMTDEEADKDGVPNAFVSMRIADHTHNRQNGDDTLNIVVADDDPTKTKFQSSKEDLRYTTKDNAEEIVKDILDFWRQYAREYFGDINKQFNDDLDEFERNRLLSSRKFNLGRPSPILMSAGLNGVSIQMTQSVLSKHLDKHNLKTDDLRELPEAIRTPIMVYEWGDKARNSVIVTSIPRGEERITTTIRLTRDGNKLNVNEISSIYGKSAERLIRDINTPKSEFGKDNLRYVDKKQVLDWFAMEAPKASSQTQQELITATKVIENFENPPINEKKVIDDTTNDMVRYSIRANDQLDREDEIMGKKAAEIYEARVKLRKQMNQSDPKKMPNKEIFDDLSRKTEAKRMKFVETVADQYRAVKSFVDTLNEHGYNISDYNNWYMNVFALAGKNEAEFDKYQAERSIPLQRAAKAAMDSGQISYRELENYLILKHGQERNEYFTERDKGLGIEPLKDVDREDTRLY